MLSGDVIALDTFLKYNAYEIFLKGLSFHRKGEYYKAMKEYENVIETEPNAVTTWYNMGIAYQELGKYDKAIDAYKIALKINSNLVEAWCCLSIAYYKLGQREESIKAYKMALKINPNIIVDDTYNPQFSYLKYSEMTPKINKRITSFFQYSDGTVEIETPKFCPLCVNKNWKRIIENSIIKKYCLLCGYEVIIGRVHQRQEPSATPDHWSGSRDNIENILEKNYEKGKR